MISFRLLLADDDSDDCWLFEQALDELPFDFNLAIAQNGEMAMKMLKDETKQLPDILFLDLNMPRKNGYECLTEIKKHDHLKTIPVIIISTSPDPDMLNLLYRQGARYFIKKPSEYAQLKNLINKVISLVSSSDPEKITQEHFIIRP